MFFERRLHRWLNGLPPIFNDRLTQRSSNSPDPPAVTQSPPAARKPSERFAVSCFPIAASKEISHRWAKQHFLEVGLTLSVRKSVKEDLFPVRMVWLMISARDGRSGISSYFNMACFCYLVPDKLSACRIVFLEASSITFNFVISFFFYVSEECSASPLHWTSFSTRVCPLEQLGQETA